MRARFSFSMLTLCLLVLIPNLAGTLGYRNPSVDPRAGGMANAVSVDTESPAVIYFNPAGMSYLDGVEVSFGVDMVVPSYSYRSTAGATAKSDRELFAIPDLYVGYKPTGLNIAFGLALNAPYGLGIDWGEDSFAKYDIYKAKLSLFNIQPTVSFLFTKHLSLGFGINIYAGTLDFRSKVNTEILAPGVVVPPEDFDIRFKGTGYQQTLNIGLIWKPQDKITMGVSYKTGSNMTFDGDLNVSNAPLGLGLGSDTAAYKSQAMLLLPPVVTWGMEYRPSRKWKLEFDVDWTRWSSFKTQALTVIDNPAFSQTFVRNWEDSFMYSFGGQWGMNEWLALRFGYTFAEKSIPEATFEPSIPDTDRHIIACGFGIKYKKYRINIAYQAVLSEANTVDTNVLAPLVDLDGTYDAFTNIASLGMQYTF